MGGGARKEPETALGLEAQGKMGLPALFYPDTSGYSASKIE
jgi:hypothetical protein